MVREIRDIAGIRDTPTVMMLVAGSLSVGGLHWWGWSLHALNQWRVVAELPDRRRPGQVLDDFNLYCEERGVWHSRSKRRKESAREKVKEKYRDRKRET